MRFWSLRVPESSPVQRGLHDAFRAAEVAHESSHWSVDGAVSIRRLAERQRLMSLLEIVSFLVHAAKFVSLFVAIPHARLVLGIPLGMVALATVVAVFRMNGALGSPMLVRILYVPLCLIPLINLLILDRVNRAAADALHAVGIEVDSWGATHAAAADQALVRACSHCGHELPQEVHDRCAACGMRVN